MKKILFIIVLSLTFIVSADSKYTYLGAEVSEKDFNEAYDKFKDSLVFSFGKVIDIGVNIEWKAHGLKKSDNVKIPEGTRGVWMLDEIYVYKIIDKKSLFFNTGDVVLCNIDTTGMTEGQNVKKSIIAVNSGFYNYTTDTDVKQNLRKYTVATTVTKEQFKTYLDSGATLYSYKVDKTTPCSSCSGTGQKKIHNVSGKCPSCKGSGEKESSTTQIKPVPYTMKQ